MKQMTMLVVLFGACNGGSSAGGDEKVAKPVEPAVVAAPTPTPTLTPTPTPTPAKVDLRSVPWAEQDFHCDDTRCTKKVQQVVYGDVEGDGVDEAVVVVIGTGEYDQDEAAHLFGVRDGKLVWLGRLLGDENGPPEYAPKVTEAVLGGGKIQLTWRVQLWGHFDDPSEAVGTMVETFVLRNGRAVRATS
ncbi:MAG TPA: hypothetical protein VM261_27600 [Kofleriaceae bacterium]|nr:hypothetical protein [Kofleriaceae bacterium]